MTSAHSCHILWQITDAQVKDHQKFLYVIKEDGTKGRKHTTGAKITYLNSCVFYNNLHSFTRLIAVAGIYPTLQDTAHQAVPALTYFQKALDGNSEAANQCKAFLNTITKTMINKVVPREFGIYLRKIHIQDYLQAKTLLLPTLAFILTRFELTVGTRNDVWPHGYLCKIGANAKADAPRMLPCLKYDPTNKKERPMVPIGYLALRAGDINHKTPLCFEFLPFITLKCKLSLLGKSLPIVSRVNDWFSRPSRRRPPILTIRMEAPQPRSPSKSPSPTKKGGRPPKAPAESPQEKSKQEDTAQHTTTETKTQPETDDSANKINSKDNDEVEVIDVDEVAKIKAASDQEMEIMNTLKNIDVDLTKDFVEIDAEFKWDGDEEASKEDIYEALIQDRDRRLKYLPLLKLCKQLESNMQGERFDELLGLPQFVECGDELFDKYQKICEFDFGQATCTDETIDKHYSDAVHNYNLENVERIAEEKRLIKARAEDQRIEKEIEKQRAISLEWHKTQFAATWRKRQSDLLASLPKEFKENDIRQSIITALQDTTKKDWLLSMCENIEFVSDDFINEQVGALYALQLKRLCLNGDIEKAIKNGKSVTTFFTLHIVYSETVLNMSIRCNNRRTKTNCKDP